MRPSKYVRWIRQRCALMLPVPTVGIVQPRATSLGVPAPQGLKAPRVSTLLQTIAHRARVKTEAVALINFKLSCARARVAFPDRNAT